MLRYLTTNGISGTYDLVDPFTLRYRRVNGTFYELILYIQTTAHIICGSLHSRLQAGRQFDGL
jgi:hypothetical protein